MIAGRSLIYGRYLLPMLPCVCLIAGVALVSGVTLLRRFDVPRTPRRLLIAGRHDRGGAAAAVGVDRLRSRHQRQATQELAYRWAISNIPPGSRVAIEKYDMRLDEPRFRPSTSCA